MPILLDLPTELLLPIIRALRLKDLVLFALSNKFIYTVAKDVLRERLELKKKYSTLTFGGYEDTMHPDGCNQVDDVHDAILFLVSTFKDYEVADFPTTLQIGDCGKEDGTGLDKSGADDKYLTRRQRTIYEYSSEFNKVIDQCCLMVGNYKAETLDTLCLPGGEGRAVGLLLTLLPGLVAVTIQNWSHDSEKVQEVVRQIAQANRNPESSSYQTALPNLSQFSIDSTRTIYGEDMQLYAPFAMLPSMRSLYGIKIDDCLFKWPTGFKSHSSTVTEIILHDSAIESANIEVLLEGIAALKKFTYHHGGGTLRSGDYDPAGIVDALRKHAAGTLEMLDIEAHDTFSVDEEVTPFVGSLQMFTALKSIRLEEQVFLKNDNDKPYTVKDAVSNEVEALFHQGYPWVPLIDILPASITCFTLLQMFDNKVTRTLLGGMAKHKSEKLPALKVITFECPDPLEPEMKQALKDTGLVLKSRRTIL